MTGPSRRGFLTAVWGTGAATVSSRSWIGIADRVVTEVDVVLAGDRVRTLRAADGGGFLVGGDVGGSVWFQRLRSDGTRRWQQTYATDVRADPNLHAIALAPDGGYALVAGDRDQWRRGGTDAYVIRTDADGRKRWRASVTVPDRKPSSAVELSSGVAVGPDGDVYAAGGVLAAADRSTPTAARPWVARLAPDGTERWTRTYGVDGATAGTAVPGVRELAATGDGARALVTVGGTEGAGLVALDVAADGSAGGTARFNPDGLVATAEPYGEGYVLGVAREGDRPNELVVVDRSLAPRRRISLSAAGTLHGVTPLEGGGFLTAATRGQRSTVLTRVRADGSVEWTHTIDGRGTVVAASGDRYATVVGGDRFLAVAETGAQTLDGLLALAGGGALLTAGAAVLGGGDDE